MKPRIRELRPSDMAAYVDLCASRRELDRRAAEARAELVEWIAFHNPDADGNPTYFVVELGDRLMGHLGRMPTRFSIEGQPHLASYVHDLFVHPELVGVGQGFFLSMQLYREAERASQSFCALVWTNEINLALQKARKYHPMWADRRVKLLRADTQIDKLGSQMGSVFDLPLVKSAGKTVASAALRTADGILQGVGFGWRSAGVTRAKAAKLVQIDRFDRRFDGFAERLAGRLAIHPVKSSAYLNWKYTDRPQLESVHYAAMDDRGQICGLVVVCVPDSEFRESFILELCADPEDRATVALLIKRAVDHCRRAGAYTIQCMATDPRMIAVLERFLFVPRPPKEPFFLANPDRYSRPAVLRAVDNWHLSAGDSEGTV
ncbi:MAG: GNAT family N-acetyltransferase [Proteobacteria bacterium]|nr:GNAT family N-acetyltransferase [Pseudomonadota bacterium]